MSVGHVTIDDLPVGRQIGGGALYAAITARNLGARAGLFTSSADEPGVRALLGDIDTVVVPAAQSTRLSIEYVAEGSRRQVRTSQAARLDPATIPREWLSARVVHVAPEFDELGAEIFEKFERSVRCLTPQGWLREVGAAGLVSARKWADAADVLRRVHAVVISEEDVDDVAAIAGRWIHGSIVLVVTRGDRGADVYLRGKPPVHSAAFAVTRVVDPTGAGDCFAAAFFWYFVRSGDAYWSAERANCVASFVVEEPGTLGIPTLAAVEARWKRGTRI